jgi:hypothetical protein
MIITIKGLSGSGKSSVVRRLAARGTEVDRTVSPLDGRRLSSTYVHPDWSRPLTVVGCYERTGGGCDALRLADGGLTRLLDLVATAHGRGDHVLLEGNRLSFDPVTTGRLAEAGSMRIVLLLVPPATCAENLRRRRRLAGSRLPELTGRLETEARHLHGTLAVVPPAAGLVRAAGPAAAVELVDGWISV